MTVSCKLERGCYGDDKCHYVGALERCPNAYMTNADRIRSMSDEELAMCLYEIGYEEGWDKPEYALKWLQQPQRRDKQWQRKTVI